MDFLRKFYLILPHAFSPYLTGISLLSHVRLGVQIFVSLLPKTAQKYA